MVTRKATGFKSLRLKYWEIHQVTPKCQIDFWTKLAKKGRGRGERSRTLEILIAAVRWRKFYLIR